MTQLRGHPRLFRTALIVALVAASASVGAGSSAAAEAPVGLGTADAFAVLAGAGITNTGPSTITGDIGTYPTTDETGFGPGADAITLTGTNHAGDAVTQQAKTDLVVAYVDAAGRVPATVIPTDLAGQTLLPGVYTSANGTFANSGVLTLDGENLTNPVWVFQTESTLITSSGSSVDMIRGAEACNVYWQVGSSATLGTGSALVGTVLAHDSITANTAATIQGRLLARNAAVTLDTNTITRVACATTTAPGDTSGTNGAGSGTTGGGTTTGTGSPGSPATPVLGPPALTG